MEVFTLASLQPLAELQTLTPSDPQFTPLFCTQDINMPITISLFRCVGIGWALLGGDYILSTKDFVLCGDEGRKARSPTLRMGDLHFAELIMLIHDVLSKVLLRPILPNCSRDPQF